MPGLWHKSHKSCYGRKDQCEPLKHKQCSKFFKKTQTIVNFFKKLLYSYGAILRRLLNTKT